MFFRVPGFRSQRTRGVARVPQERPVTRRSRRLRLESLEERALLAASFNLTAPTTGVFSAGQTISIQWTASNVVAGSTISLAYDTDTAFNGNEHWIEIDKVTAANGGGSYAWSTYNVPSGSYFIAGYLYDGRGNYTFSHRNTSFTLSGTAPPQSFALTGPTSGNFTAGQTVSIQYTASNVRPGSTISLAYDPDTAFNGNERWIEIDKVVATNGSSSFAWNTTGVLTGTYTIAGYLYDGQGTYTTSHLAQTFRVQGVSPAQSFVLTSPTSGTFNGGQTINIQWNAANVVAGSTISLAYDTDTAFNGNEHWIEIDKVVAANGAGSFAWNTANVPLGSYFIAGYMYDGRGTFTTSHLNQSFTISTPTPPQAFSLSGPTSGNFLVGQTVSIQWSASGVRTGSKISLAYDIDTSFNGNERWIEVDQVSAVNGNSSFLWNTAGVTPGLYSIAGYMWDGQGTFTTSHLFQFITISSPPSSFALTSSTLGGVSSDVGGGVSHRDLVAAVMSEWGNSLEDDTGLLLPVFNSGKKYSQVV